MTNKKSLVSEANRKVPINISLELRLRDIVSEEAFKRFGMSEGKISETVSQILKEYFHIK